MSLGRYFQKDTIFCFSSLLLDMQTRSELLQLVNIVFTCIPYLQIVLSSFYTSSISLWKGNGQIPAYITMFSYITRLIPVTYSSQAHNTITFLILGIALFSWLLMIFILYSYKWIESSTRHFFPSMILIPIFSFRFFFLPTIAICGYYVIRVFYNTQLAMLLIINVISLVLIMYGVFLAHWILQSFPVITHSFGYKWNIQVSVLYSFATGFLFISNEIVDFIEFKGYKTALISFSIILWFIFVLREMKALFQVTLESNIFLLFVYSYSICIMVMIVLSINKIIAFELVFPFALIIIIPIYFLISFLTNRSFNKLNKEFLAYYDEGNKSGFDMLMKYKEKVLLSSLGHSSSRIVIGKEFIEWCIFQYQGSFSLLIFFGKICIMNKEYIMLLPKVLLMMNKFTSLSIAQKSIIRILDIASFPVSNENNSEIGTDLCQKALYNYAKKIFDFWSDILYRKSDKLIELASEANDSYSTLLTIFSLFGPKDKTIDFFTHQYSIIHSVKSKLVSRSFGSRNFRDFFDNKTILNGSQDSQISHNDDDVNSSTLEAHQNYPQRMVTFYRTLLFVLPFFMFVISSFLLMGLVSYIIDNYYNVFKFTEALYNAITSMSAACFCFPLVPLSNFTLDMTIINGSIDNNVLFPSKLSNVRNDIVSICDDLFKFSQEFIGSYSRFPYQDLLNKADDRLITIMNSYNDGIVPVYPFLFSYLKFFSVRHAEVASRSDYDILLMFGSIRFTLYLNNTMSNIKFLSKLLLDVSNEASKRLISDISNNLLYFIYLICIFLGIGLITMFLLLKFYFDSYSSFFHSLFLLPKQDISSHMAYIDSTILSCFKYESSNKIGSHMKTSTIMIKMLAGGSFNLVTLSVFVIGIAYYMLQSVKSSAQQLPALEYYCFIPLDVLNIHINAFEVINLYLFNINITVGTIEDRIIRTLEIANQASKRKTKMYSSNNIYQADAFYSSLLNVDSDKDYHMSNADLISYCISNTMQVLTNAYHNQYLSLEDSHSIIATSIRTITKTIPLVGNTFFLTMESNHNGYIAQFSFLLIAHSLFFFFIYFGSLVYSKRIPTPKALSNSVIATLPDDTFAQFHNYVDSNYVSSVSQDYIEACKNILKEIETFCQLNQSILLIGENHRIMSSTLKVYKMFQIESLDQMGSNFSEFISHIKTPDTIISLPPEIHCTYEFDARLQDGNTIFLKVELFPIKGLVFAGIKLEYVSAIYDISQSMELVKQNHAVNNLMRIVVTQFVPSSIASPLLYSSDDYPIIGINNVILSTFYFTGIKKSQEIEHLKNLVRNNLNEKSCLLFLGRSIQCFRVFSKIESLDLSIEQKCSQHIWFCLDLLKSIKESPDLLGLNVYCMIDLLQSALALLIEKVPPVFDIFGSLVNQNLFTTLQCPPGQVNITRNIYEIMYDGPFNITFENTIKQINQGKIQIHQVQSREGSFLSPQNSLIL